MAATSGWMQTVWCETFWFLSIAASTDYSVGKCRALERHVWWPLFASNHFHITNSTCSINSVPTCNELINLRSSIRDCLVSSYGWNRPFSLAHSELLNLDFGVLGASGSTLYPFAIMMPMQQKRSICLIYYSELSYNNNKNLTFYWVSICEVETYFFLSVIFKRLPVRFLSELYNIIC